MCRNFGKESTKENIEQLSLMVKDIFKESASEIDIEYLTGTISRNWSIFDFSKVTEGTLIQAMQHFPVMSDVFLDGNDKLQTSQG